MNRFVFAFALAWTLALPAARAAQDVANTKHNLSAVPPVGVTRTFASAAVDEICVFCHTPHNSLPTAPLWNHLPTAAVTYTPYASSTLAATPGQPTGKSRLCLACHDGTVALGALQNPPANNDMAATLLTGRTLLGTDLSDDHPISFDYAAAVAGELADPVAIDLPLEGTQLQCTTCHDPHEKDLVPFLHKTTANGALCTTCHVRSGATWDWATSSHANSPAATPVTVWPERNPDWPGPTVAANGCLSCHDLHTAAMPQRLITKVEENTCYACHNGTVAATNIQAEFLKTSRHPVALRTPNPDHDATKVENVLTMPIHVECMDCHNPHAVQAAPPMITFNPANIGAAHTTAPAANARIKGVTGIDANGNPIAEINNQYELCFKCHGRPAQGPCGGIPTDRCSTATTFSMVRLDNVYNIREKLVSGTPGLVSYHPVEANDPSNNTAVPSLRNDVPGMNRTTGLIYCTDCHNNNQSAAAGGTGPIGPHGSTNNALLTQNYSFIPTVNYTANLIQLCYKCHSEASILSDASFREHRLHVEQNDKLCINCHDPHGSHRFQHLLNFQTNSTAGGTWTITTNCTGAPGSCGGGFTQPTWEDRGVFSGACWLDCHERDNTRRVAHDPFTY